MKSNTLYAELQVRGLVAQATDPRLADALEHQKLTYYVGFDPTSDSLHIGSLLPLITMRRLQLHGHKPLVVLGGATGRIGDPSGKAAERVLLDEAQVVKNLEGIRRVVHRFLEPSGPNGVEILDNFDWFKGMGAIPFLRDVGKHFTVNHMMGKESVRARLEDRDQGISFTEFAYMLLQAYDFEVLFRTKQCRLQMGATDQWGNITAGCELIRRRGLATDADPAFGLTHPLVLKADGSKFGKTESGTIWLDPKRTSPYAFYQFLVQTADADVVQMLKFFTFLPIEEIDRLATLVTSAPEKREAQTRLAQELTRIVHGDAELLKAEKATQALFTEDIRNLDESTLLGAMSGAPTTSIARNRLQPSVQVLDLLVETGLCGSRGAAKKDLQAGGIYINNTRVQDVAHAITEQDLICAKYLVLRKGKRTYHWIVFE